MSPINDADLGLDACSQSLARDFGPYAASSASSASSSQISVFSDSASAQSSIASSIVDDFRCSQEESRNGTYASSCAPSKSRAEQVSACLLTAACGVAPTYADITSVPPQQRQHPRRSSLARNQKPPPLVRQCERKINFVDNLVDSATQMVEVIWPLSAVPCRGEPTGGRGVLPLRTYIEETLRRSRTSYSTLQVALYYLIMIKPFVPRGDFTQPQQTHCPTGRALMCGRRMFLAALILASKYLQDRNYSSKAWSKMSGLRANEINTNERTFLEKVNWKLHIPQTIFHKWTEIVLKYTPDMQPPSPPTYSLLIPPPTWRGIIPLLTPELDKVPLPKTTLKVVPPPSPASLNFATSMTSTPTTAASDPVRVDTMSHQNTPTPLTVLPRFLEPRPDVAPPTPALARMGPLPTPQMTPSSVASSTPAVSVCDSRRPSICSAMAMVQKAGLTRSAIDMYPIAPSYPPSRRPSVTSAASSGSSPESMISDHSRSSRASSISSITTASTSSSSLAPSRACLARQATCRNVRLPLPPTLRERAGKAKDSATKSSVIADDVDMASSPEIIDFTLSERALHAPHRHSKHAPQTHAVTAPKSLKRTRAHGGSSRRSDIQDEIRFQLEQDLMDVDIGDDDDDIASPSPAADSAARMLSRSVSKEVQPPASLARRESCRMPIQKDQGKKRTCCSTPAKAMAMSLSPSPVPLFGEVI